MKSGVTIKDIVDLCVGPVTISVNEYKSNYWSFQEALEDLVDLKVPAHIIREIRESGHIVECQAYPHTPVGFEITFGGTDDLALERMYELLTKDEEE